MNRYTARAAFEEAIAASLTPAGLESYRLDRLQELRAVIDSLRAERGQVLLPNARAERDHFCHS